MKPFDYYSPKSLEETVRILSEYGRDARGLAGGTDLLIRIKRKQWTPSAVVNLKQIPGLHGLAMNGELRLGPLVTLNELARTPLIQEHFPVLASTASQMAGVQVRNLATVGGNLCNASPAADMAPPLMALNARAVIRGTSGERVVPLSEFFAGVGASVLAPDEILSEILVPRPQVGEQSSYLKLEHRRAMDIAIVGVGVWSRSGGQYCEDIRITLGAVAPTPLRAGRAEAVLRGAEWTVDRIRQAACVAAEEAKPIDDVRASAWYRREMIEVLTRRQLLQMASQSPEKDH